MIRTEVGPEFGYDKVKVMLVVRELYVLKSYEAYFRDLICEQLH